MAHTCWTTFPIMEMLGIKSNLEILVTWGYHYIQQHNLNSLFAIEPSIRGMAYQVTCTAHHHRFVLLSLIGVRCARPGESENTLSVQRAQPHTTNLYKEEKDKTVGDKRERADHVNRKALALLLKPASPTPSNTGSLRSFQRDKASAILRSPTMRRRERVPMRNQSTMRNTCWHIRQRQCTA